MTDTPPQPPTVIESVLEAGDGHGIPVTRWEPAAAAGPPVVVQILHGVSEHIGRYGRFAEACCTRGFAAIGHDHRGHGRACPPAELGHIADRNGWKALVDDALAVRALAGETWPGVPIVLFGHSMGSYLAQSAAARGTAEFSALILSAPTFGQRARLRAGRVLTRLAIATSGGRHVSGVLRRIAFDSFNRRFAPTRTDVDWLTRDHAEVDRNVADPLCGIPVTNRLWHELLGGMLEVTSRRTLWRIPASMPILITGGTDDPVGGQIGMPRLAEALERTGHARLTVKVWPGGRHEMLNETNREEFTAFLLHWIDTSGRTSASP